MKYTYNEDDAIPIKTKRKKNKINNNLSSTAVSTINRADKIKQQQVRIAEKSPIQTIEKNDFAVYSEKKNIETKKFVSDATTKYTVNHSVAAVKTSYVKEKSKSRSYKIPYLIFVAFLLAVSIGIIIYVHGALVDYEASQPENILSSHIEKLKEAKSLEEFEKILPLDSLRNDTSASNDELWQFCQDMLAGEIKFKENHDSLDATKKVFDVISDGFKVASITLEHIGQETKLLIFTLDRWNIGFFETNGWQVEFTAPSSVIVKNGEEGLSGEKKDDTSKVFYNISSLTKPEITISDILGNSEKYDRNNIPQFTDYKITIPSNFTLKGKETVSRTVATLEPIDSLKYVKEYCDSVPDMATYVISVMNDSADFTILDNNGDPVDFEINGQKIKIEEQVGKNFLSLDVDIDPLEVAKLWSFFMTQDLDGKNNGYYKISPYLIDDSYLQGVAWKWATGIDITFTSAHTLENPPFCTEKISNYTVYSDECFSCDILLEKNMHLSTGMTVKDTINSTFYFIKYDDTDNGIDDAHWVLVDYKEIN